MRIKFLLKLLMVFALVAGLCLLGCEGPTGPNGPNGDDGKNGANSSEKGDPGDKGPDGLDGDKGPDGDPYSNPEDPDDTGKGAPGADGEPGFNGASVIIMGVLDAETDLPHSGGMTAGVVDAYIVNGILYVWDITNQDWINTHQLVQGAVGERGDKGPPGEKGHESGNAVTVYSVTFDPANIPGGSTPSTVIVIDGGKILPVTPAAKTLADFPMDSAGLYRDTYIFDGWFETDDDGNLIGDAWDFNHPFTKDTDLTAGWTAPPALAAPGGLYVLTGTTAAGVNANNLVSSAFSYMNENVAGKAGSYVLYLGADSLVTSTSLTLSRAARQVKIVALPDAQGEEVERKITQNSGTYILLDMSEGTSVTLDKNVTLVGRNNLNNPLVRVRTNAQFIMEDGSKLTGNTTTIASGTATTGQAAGVMVNGGTFIMKGGEISGLSMTSISNSNAGLAVYVGSTNAANIGRFIMEGGEIKDNTGDGLADVYIEENTYLSTVAALTLSGEAKPGAVAVNITNAAQNRSIVIAADWEGEIAGLDLRGNRGDIYDSSLHNDVISLWYNNVTPADSPVIIKEGLTADNVDQIILRNFVGNTVVVKNTISDPTDMDALPLRHFYELDAATGQLEDIGDGS